MSHFFSNHSFSNRFFNNMVDSVFVSEAQIMPNMSLDQPPGLSHARPLTGAGEQVINRNGQAPAARNHSDLQRAEPQPIVPPVPSSTGPDRYLVSEPSALEPALAMRNSVPVSTVNNTGDALTGESPGLEIKSRSSRRLEESLSPSLVDKALEDDSNISGESELPANQSSVPVSTVSNTGDAPTDGSPGLEIKSRSSRRLENSLSPSLVDKELEELEGDPNMSGESGLPANQTGTPASTASNADGIPTAGTVRQSPASTTQTPVQIDKPGAPRFKAQDQAGGGIASTITPLVTDVKQKTDRKQKMHRHEGDGGTHDLPVDLPLSPRPPTHNASFVDLGQQRLLPTKNRININIGRIDVRATRPAKAPPGRAAAPAPSTPSLSLTDYLEQRQGGTL